MIDTVARFTITLAADPERLQQYRNPETRSQMIEALDAKFWPLTDDEKFYLQAGNFDEIFRILEERGGDRGINTIKV